MMTSWQAFANEKDSPLFVAVQISENIIKPFAEYSEGIWKDIRLESDTVNLGYDILANSPWSFTPKQAKLGDVTINNIKGSQLSHWYSTDTKIPKIVSQFTQYGNNIESERTGWGMTISGKEKLSVSEDWYEYPKRLLFSKAIFTSVFQTNKKTVVKEYFYSGIKARILRKETLEAKKYLKKCYDDINHQKLKNHAADYCGYWEAYSEVIKKVKPKMTVKKASLMGSDIYFVRITKLNPLTPYESCPNETQVQAWLSGVENNISFISEMIILTDCDGKQVSSNIIPFALAQVGKKLFVFSEDFSYEGSDYIIREFRNGKLSLVFNPNMYGEQW